MGRTYIDYLEEDFEKLKEYCAELEKDNTLLKEQIDKLEDKIFILQENARCAVITIRNNHD